MTIVSWTTLIDKQCETLCSILLLREHPNGNRIRPSQGNGGIDIIELTPDGWVVYQIKYFSANLTSDQKGQVNESFERIQEFAAQHGATIARWNLVMPLDPTTGNLLTWFNELTAGTGFSTQWLGLTHLVLQPHFLEVESSLVVAVFRSVLVAASP